MATAWQPGLGRSDKGQCGLNLLPVKRCPGD